jgi:hypothetical protein
MIMNKDARSMFSAFAQAELAGALTFAAVLGRYVELTLGYGENFANGLLDIARDSERRRTNPWDRVFAQAMAEHRDYVRELAATPSLATMNFLEQLENFRTTQSPPGHVRDATAS